MNLWILQYKRHSASGTIETKRSLGECELLAMYFDPILANYHRCHLSRNWLYLLNPTRNMNPKFWTTIDSVVIPVFGKYA